MRFALIVIITLASVQLSPGQADVPWSATGQSPRLLALQRQLESGDSKALDQFWNQVKLQHAPIIEPIPGDSSHYLVTFLYRGSAETKGVGIYAQLSMTRDLSGNRLARLGKTDVWFKTYTMRDDLRLGYSLVPGESIPTNDPDVGIADPLNPKAAPLAAFMGKSVLELPHSPPQPWVAPRPGVGPGKIEELRIQSKVLKSERPAWIYTPQGFDPSRSEPYPLLICFDGQVYASANYMPVPVIIDNMIAGGRLAPLVVVLVGQSPQPMRNIELSNNQPFLDFVADELLPKVREKWHATADPRQTVVTGSSAGGLASAFFAFRRPDVFGNVLSQSGAFWPGHERNDPDREWLTRQFDSSPKLPIRFVLQVGLLERGSTPDNGPSILDTNRHLHRVLERKGYEVHYAEIAGGHEPLNWRGGLSDGLMQLMGAPQRKTSDHPPVDAIRGIVAAFEKHPVVIIGEWQHGIQQLGDFYVRLIQDPAFQKTAPDIMIEFASRNNQPLLDRYVNGADVPPDDVKRIWRDTTKVAAWEFPMYAEWLKAIRDVNRSLAPGRRLRVLAGDTAIDWSRINSHSDWEKLGDNNVSFSEVITSEVLAKHRRALVVLGGNHVTKLGARNGDPNTTTLIEKRYPGSTYVAMHHLIPNDPEEALFQLPGNPAAATLYDLAGTSLGSTPDKNGVEPLKYVDAWLYVGPAASVTHSRPGPGTLENAYMKELDRRSLIEWGDLRTRRILGDAAAK